MIFRQIISRIPPLWWLRSSWFWYIAGGGLLWRYSSSGTGKEHAMRAKAKYESEQQQIGQEAAEKKSAEEKCFFLKHQPRYAYAAQCHYRFYPDGQKRICLSKTRNEVSGKSWTVRLSFNGSGGWYADYLKANSGKLKIQPRPVRLRELIATIIVFRYRLAAKKRTSTFTVDYSNALDRIIMADKLELQKSSSICWTNVV